MKKSVLITGANSGIGLALVDAYLRQGIFVFAHYHRSKDNLRSIECGSLMTVQGDLAEPDAICSVFQACTQTGKDVDILINNAGTFSYAESIESITRKDFNRVIRVNLEAPFLLSQLAFKGMKNKNWGRIINISSIGVKYGGGPGSIPYTVSKSGLETMTMAFAKAGAPHNILVNAVRAGVVDTGFHDLNHNKDMKKRIDMIPLKRMASPREIAETVFFLTSEKSAFTTGTVITVSGGE